ncbi:hypothetical protein [Archaeoglobus veneficus]|uniref:hypothetical protein n=1 Tax=Archaeoglobus veneficus TaxID=58290 RepID=UPI00064E8619|nr:hypothetical protein [Archaeoglobus veneficus]
MEHWGKAIPIMLEMMDKQDETIKEIREVKIAVREEGETTRKELGSIIKEESEKTRGEIGGKIDLLRSDMKEYMESNLKEIHSKISEIERALKRAGIM